MRFSCHLQFFFLTLFFLSSVTKSCFVQSIGFKWEGQLDKNGMAQSLERSMLVGKQKFFDKDDFQSIEDEFVNYPNFLARRKVLLGLFTAKTNINNSNEETTTTVCDSLFGVNLLTFGQIKTSTFSRVVKSYKPEGDGDVEIRGVTARLPVVGGILSRHPKREASDNSNSLPVLGELVFEMKQTRPNLLHTKEGNLEMETQVVDYMPALAGKPPIHFMRKALYLNSQRYFHAYVMWRFHRHCYNEMSQR